MPSIERVQQLVGYVEEGRIIEAIDEFYGDGVRMQDNNQPPTAGKEANLQRERLFVGSIAEIHENRARSVLVDGDRVAIHWNLEFTTNEGRRLRFDQVSLQRWEDDRIVDERFYYDSADLEQVRTRDRP